MLKILEKSSEFEKSLNAPSEDLLSRKKTTKTESVT